MILLSRREQKEATDGDFCKAVWQPLVFVYHCFDRIVINGYLSGFAARTGGPLVREVLGFPVVSKEVFSERTNDHRTRWKPSPAITGFRIEWAEKGVRKEDYVLPNYQARK